MQKTKWKHRVIDADGNGNGLFNACREVDQNENKATSRAGLPVCAPRSERMPRINASV
jgi:hypothetical protein